MINESLSPIRTVKARSDCASELSVLCLLSPSIYSIVNIDSVSSKPM